MPKRIIQDIIVKKRERPEVTPRKPEPRTPRPVPVRKPTEAKIPKPKKKKSGKTLFGIFAVVLAIIVCTKIVSNFSGAIIKVIPHKENLEIDALLKGGLPAQAETAAVYDTAYETMEISVTKEKTVEAEGTEEVSSRASGQIIIFNTFSSQSQVLIATTRLESSDGKIYRIREKITVPGNGSTEVTAYADEPGEEYNMESGEFKIPGFEGTPRYEKFYAKTKTPIKGGFQGVLPIISEEQQTEIREELELAIKKELLEKTRMQAPADFVFYENALRISFVGDEDANKAVREGDNLEFTMRETGNLLAFLIPRSKLTDALVKKSLGDDFVGKVKIGNMEKLEFSVISYDGETKQLVFKIKGTAEFIWVIEEDELKNALIAQPKEPEKVFKSFPAIDQASVVFKPFWWKFFPDKTSRISIYLTF